MALSQDFSLVDRAPHAAPAVGRIAGFFLTGRFARFVLFGGTAALVNLAVGRVLYTLPVFVALLPYWLAVALGSGAGLIVNFGLNYVYNFRYLGRSAVAQFRTFTAVALVGVGLTALIAQAALGIAGWLGFGGRLTAGGVGVDTAFVAHVFAVGAVTFYSFAGHSLFSFNAGLRAGLRRAISGIRETQR